MVKVNTNISSSKKTTDCNTPKLFLNGSKKKEINVKKTAIKKIKKVKNEIRYGEDIPDAPSKFIKHV
jgi:hypothetical protein